MRESTSELRGHRLDGVGRPKLDFYTDPNVHILVRTRVAVDLEAEFFPHVLVDGAHAFAHGCWRYGRLLRLRSVARGRASRWAAPGRAALKRSGGPRPGTGGCDACRSPTATRRHLPAAKKAARQPQACGQSTALIWFGFGLLACLASVRDVSRPSDGSARTPRGLVRAGIAASIQRRTTAFLPGPRAFEARAK